MKTAVAILHTKMALFRAGFLLLVLGAAAVSAGKTGNTEESTNSNTLYNGGEASPKVEEGNPRASEIEGARWKNPLTMYRKIRSWFAKDSSPGSASVSDSPGEKGNYCLHQ